MIQGIDFFNTESERYWDFAKSYKGDKKAEIKNMIFSNNYLGALKKDGHYFRYVKDVSQEISLQSRDPNVNGIYLNKMGHVPHIMLELNAYLPKGTVLLGELYFPSKPGSKVVTTIMGCLEAKALLRQEKEEKLSYYIYDIWAWNGESCLKMTFEERVKLLEGIIAPIFARSPKIEVAHYESGAALWELLSWARENGEEGIVMTKRDSTPEPGKRTSRKTVKVKQELDNEVDVFFTGNYKPATVLYTGKEIQTWKYWRNIKTEELLFGEHYSDYANGKCLEPITKGAFFGWAGSIEIGAYDIANDKIVHIGYLSGIIDAIKEEIVTDNSKYVNKPCLINAMEIDDESGKFRHAKFIRFRDDISWKNCSTDKIYGV